MSKRLVRARTEWKTDAKHAAGLNVGLPAANARESAPSVSVVIWVETIFDASGTAAVPNVGWDLVQEVIAGYREDGYVRRGDHDPTFREFLEHDLLTGSQPMAPRANARIQVFRERGSN